MADSIKILEIARKEIGVTEFPANSNKVKATPHKRDAK